MDDNERSAAEVVSRGEAIYERRIRKIVEPGNRGKFVVIDVDTGDYEIDADDLQATKRLLAKRAQAAIYGLRIGFPAAYRLGGGAAAEVE